VNRDSSVVPPADLTFSSLFVSNEQKIPQEVEKEAGDASLKGGIAVKVCVHPPEAYTIVKLQCLGYAPEPPWDSKPS
jgi:hypothetical protein